MLGSQGCATSTPSLQISLPDSLKARCDSPDPSSVRTVGDLAGYSVQQKAALEVCNARKHAIVSIVEAFNRAVKPKTRWPW